MMVLRWALVPIVAVAAWYAAILTTGLLDSAYWLFEYPCSYELVTSGGCHVVGPNWLDGYMRIMASIGAVLVALYAVVGCVLAAPSHKSQTALGVFAIGSLAAAFLGRALEEYIPMVLAIATGAGAAILMYRRHAVARVA
jgi:hypothetical protein